MARKKGFVASEEDKTLRSGEPKKSFSITPGRLINFSIAIIFFCAFIAAAVVVGLIADVQHSVKSHKDSSNNTHGCILFSKCVDCNEGEQHGFNYDTAYECEFTIAGYAIILVISFILLVVSVIRGILGYNIWLTAIIETIILTMCVLFAFVISVMVSIGLRFTCDAVKEYYGDGSCNQMVPNDNGFGYYHKTNSAQAAAWFTFIFLTVALVIFIAKVVIYFRRLKKTKDDRDVLTANDHLTESLPPRPI